jgi:hypothetical protein
MFKLLRDHISIEAIRQTLHKLDLTNRPYVIFLHPEDAEAFKAYDPTLAERILIQPFEFVEKGKGVIVKREDLEIPPALKSVEFVPEFPKYHE